MTIRKIYVAGMLSAAAMLAAGASAPLAGQTGKTPTIGQCGGLVPTAAERKNLDKLRAKRACFVLAGGIASAAVQSMDDAIAAVTPAPTPTPSPTPTPTPVPTPTPTPTPSPTFPDPTSTAAIWEKCVGEGGTCNLPYKTNVRFGNGAWTYKRDVSGALACNYRDLGDPAPGAYKECWYQVPGNAKAPLANAAGFKLGVNLTGVTYYSPEPTLANLLTGSRWNINGADIKVDPVNGITVPKGQVARRYLTTPPATLGGQPAKIVCSWEGASNITLAGNGGMVEKTSTSVAINVTPYTPTQRGALIWMDIFETPAAGARNFDCRVSTLARSVVLAPEVVDSLRPFKVLRFLDWSNVNGNPTGVTWANRTRPDALNQGDDAPLGVAIEHMVALANATGAAPWFNVPWNADADYQQRMARLVHDSLPADREVYVELSNEVWNDSFGVTGQARKEGIDAGLSKDQREAVVLRYAEKVRAMMPIWSAVFADRPGKLVRIAGSQVGANPIETLLGKGKLAGAVDAVAIAPYVGGNLMSTPNKGVAADLAVLSGEVETWESAKASEAKNVARKYATRVVMYEGGQHLVGSDVDRMIAVNRADGMKDVYRAYIRTWRDEVKDTMVLYNSRSTISRYGAWGLQEYLGQPLTSAPKMAAALEFTN